MKHKESRQQTQRRVVLQSNSRTVFVPKQSSRSAPFAFHCFEFCPEVLETWGSAKEDVEINSLGKEVVPQVVSE